MTLFLWFSNCAFKDVTSDHARSLLLNLGKGRDMWSSKKSEHGLKWPGRFYYEVYYEPETYYD